MRQFFACSLTLLAGAGGDAPQEDTFTRMDTDKNGVISLQEFKAAFPNMRDEAFAAIDTNKDKVIDRAEWDAFVKNHAAGMMQGKGSQGMMGGSQGMMGGSQNMMGGDAPAGMPLVTPPAGK